MKFKAQLGIAFLLLASHCARAGQLCPEANRFFPSRELGRVRANRMSQLSGMAASRSNPDILWVHNGEKIDRFFAITRDGRPAGTFTLPQDLLDAEDVAIGPGPLPGTHYLYLGDIGDSTRQRRTVVVVRAPEPKVDSKESETQPLAGAGFLSLSYPDGGHDAEALLIDPLSGALYIVTKEEGRALVFSARREQLSEDRSPMLEHIATVALDRVTGGDISRDGQRVALRTRTTAVMWSRLPSQSLEEALAQSPIPIPLASDEQGEALAFHENGGGYFTVSEGADQPINYFAANQTRFTVGQPLGVVAAPNLMEISGIAASRRNPGIIWMHNDGTNRNIFAVSTNGNVLATYVLTQSVVDLEDCAAGPGESPGSFDLYLADIGDNTSERENIRVIRVPEPHLAARTGQTGMMFSGGLAFRLRYPDGSHNAEALLVDPLSGDLYIATKEDKQFRLYRASKSELALSTSVSLSLVHTGQFGLVSAGDISADGLLIALRNEASARLWKRAPGQTVAEALAGSGEELPVIGPPNEPNGESLSFLVGEGGYVTFSEGEAQSINLFQPLLWPAFIGAPVRVEHDWQLLLTGCAGGQVQLQVSDDLVRWILRKEITLTDEPNPFRDSDSRERLFYRLVVP